MEATTAAPVASPVPAPPPFHPPPPSSTTRSPLASPLPTSTPPTTAPDQDLSLLQTLRDQIVGGRHPVFVVPAAKTAITDAIMNGHRDPAPAPNHTEHVASNRVDDSSAAPALRAPEQQQQRPPPTSTMSLPLARSSSANSSSSSVPHVGRGAAFPLPPPPPSSRQPLSHSIASPSTPPSVEVPKRKETRGERKDREAREVQAARAAKKLAAEQQLREQERLREVEEQERKEGLEREEKLRKAMEEKKRAKPATNTDEAEDVKPNIAGPDMIVLDDEEEEEEEGQIIEEGEEVEEKPVVKIEPLVNDNDKMDVDGPAIGQAGASLPSAALAPAHTSTHVSMPPPAKSKRPDPLALAEQPVTVSPTALRARARSPPLDKQPPSTAARVPRSGSFRYDDVPSERRGRDRDVDTRGAPIDTRRHDPTRKDTFSFPPSRVHRADQGRSLSPPRRSHRGRSLSPPPLARRIRSRSPPPSRQHVRPLSPPLPRRDLSPPRFQARRPPSPPRRAARGRSFSPSRPMPPPVGFSPPRERTHRPSSPVPVRAQPGVGWRGVAAAVATGRPVPLAQPPPLEDRLAPRQGPPPPAVARTFQEPPPPPPPPAFRRDGQRSPPRDDFRRLRSPPRDNRVPPFEHRPRPSWEGPMPPPQQRPFVPQDDRRPIDRREDVRGPLPGRGPFERPSTVRPSSPPSFTRARSPPRAQGRPGPFPPVHEVPREQGRGISPPRRRNSLEIPPYRARPVDREPPRPLTPPFSQRAPRAQPASPPFRDSRPPQSFAPRAELHDSHLVGRAPQAPPRDEWRRDGPVGGPNGHLHPLDRDRLVQRDVRQIQHPPPPNSAAWDDRDRRSSVQLPSQRGPAPRDDFLPPSVSLARSSSLSTMHRDPPSLASRRDGPPVASSRRDEPAPYARDAERPSWDQTRRPASPPYRQPYVPPPQQREPFQRPQERESFQRPGDFGPARDSNNRPVSAIYDDRGRPPFDPRDSRGPPAQRRRSASPPPRRSFPHPASQATVPPLSQSQRGPYEAPPRARYDDRAPQGFARPPSRERDRFPPPPPSTTNTFQDRRVSDDRLNTFAAAPPRPATAFAPSRGAPQDRWSAPDRAPSRAAVVTTTDHAPPPRGDSPPLRPRPVSQAFATNAPAPFPPTNMPPPPPGFVLPPPGFVPPPFLPPTNALAPSMAPPPFRSQSVAPAPRQAPNAGPPPSNFRDSAPSPFPPYASNDRAPPSRSFDNSSDRRAYQGPPPPAYDPYQPAPYRAPPPPTSQQDYQRYGPPPLKYQPPPPPQPPFNPYRREGERDDWRGPPRDAGRRY